MPLRPNSISGQCVAGKAYFISNDEPMPLWDIVNAILAAGHLPPVTRSLPAGFAYALGAGFLKVSTAC